MGFKFIFKLNICYFKKEKTCVYLKKNIEFCGMRCSVRQMWAPNGDIVTCGYISEKTRVCLIDLYILGLFWNKKFVKYLNPF